MPRKRKQIVRLVIKRQDRIDYIMAGVCNYFKITPDDIKKLRYTKKAVPRRLAVKILRDIADITFEEIGATLNLTSGSTFNQYTAVSCDLDRNNYGNTELKRTYKELLERLDL